MKICNNRKLSKVFTSTVADQLVEGISLKLNQYT